MEQANHLTEFFILILNGVQKCNPITKTDCLEPTV